MSAQSIYAAVGTAPVTIASFTIAPVTVTVAAVSAA